VKRKIIGYVCGVLAASNAFADIATDLSAGSQGYSYVEKLEALGCALPTLRSIGPQSSFDIQAAVEGDIENSSCKAPEWLLDERQVLLQPVPPAEVRLDGFSAVEDRVALVGIPATLWPLFPLRHNRPTVNGINLSSEISLGTRSQTQGWGYAIAITPGFFLGRDTNTAFLGRFYIQEGYAKVGMGFAELLVGRYARRFGEVKHGSLLYSSAMAPLDTVEAVLRPVVPSGFFSFLGPTSVRAWLASQSENTGIRETLLFGAEWAFRPTRAWEFSLAQLAQFGGATGVPTPGNLSVAVNSSFWAFKKHLKLYGQFLAERLLAGPGTPISYSGGLWFPKLGRWDLRLEAARTGAQSYQHPVWTQGLTYRGAPLGHPLGPDSQGLYLDVGLPPIATWWRSELGLVYEARGLSLAGATQSETRYGVQATLGRRFGLSDIHLKAAFHRLQNPQYVSGEEADLLGLGLVYRYTFLY
jgi:hypothetical protein